MSARLYSGYARSIPVLHGYIQVPHSYIPVMHGYIPVPHGIYYGSIQLYSQKNAMKMAFLSLLRCHHELRYNQLQKCVKCVNVIVIGSF